MSVAIFISMVASATFQCKIDVPAGAVGASRTATVTYSNDGSSAIAAPYVRLEAGDNAYVRFSDSDAWSKSVEFLATSEQSPASSLRAGETVEVPVFVYTAAQEVQLTLSYTQSSTEAFPWSDIGSSLKPSYVTGSAWTFALATLKSRLGTTWNSYLSRLRANADSLAENGRPVRRLDRLLQIEINHALGVDAVLPVLASVTDAARSARGMGLSFTRSYSSAMYGRFTSGILGYGWTDNLSTCAELSSDGKTLVFRVPNGGSYSFTKATGSWKPEDSRDKTVLAESSSAYTLTYQSGTVQTFAKSNMRTSSIADNSGNTLTFTWSGTTLQKIVHKDGQTLTFAYSGGLLSSVTDDCGRQTTYTYSNSLLTKVTASDGLETFYEYRPADGTAAARALSRIVYFDGTTREFTYDTSSGLVSAISSNGGKEKTTISRNGGVVTLTGPDGAETTVKTGVSGEVLETTDALGGVSTKRYTADGLLKSVVSPSGLNGKIEHDALGRVSKSVSAAGTTTAFAYEETFGNLKTVTDAKNHVVTYGYDAKGRGTSVTFADGSASKLEYNSRGDVVKSTNRRGETVTYAYDSKGRIKKKTWSNGRTFAYAYDEEGNLVAASDSETGQVSMYYIVGGRLRCIFYPNGRAIFYDYDSETGKVSLRKHGKATVTGRPKSPNPEYEIWQEEFMLEYDEDSEEVFAYDASGRLASVSDGNGATYLQNTYDETTGRLARQVNGNGTSVSYLYDKLGRVVSIEHCDAEGKIVESLQYCYDADGRCIRAASLLGEERYEYDKDGQLISVRYPDSPSEAFAYDAVGNRTTANGATYTVNNLNQYTAISGGSQSSATAITYDKDGNMTSLKDADGTTTYTYDTLNRLVAVKNTTKGIDWSCQYDVFGNRVSVTENGVTTERIYLQGSLPSVAAEYVNGQLKERHIVVGAVRVADISRTGGSPVQNEETRYYHADLIGSTRLVTGGNGTVLDRRAYKAFGETRVGDDTISTAGYVGTLGVETDPTGLLFMRNRYYSPALGRFIQMDPIGLDGEDVNLYRYCENDPMVGVDPNGKFAITAAAIAIGAKAVLAYGAKAILAYGYSKIIVHSAEEIWDFAINGSFDEQQWKEDVKYLVVDKVVGPVIGKAASTFTGVTSTEPMIKVGKKTIPLTVGIAKNWRATTVARKYYPYLQKALIESLMKKMFVDAYVEVPVSEAGGSGGGSGGSGGGSGGGGSGGGSGSIMSESDWLDIATNYEWVAEKDGYVGQVATYSLGADITLTNPKYLIGNFKGKFIGNGHKVMVGAGKTVFQDADGATFSTGAFTSDGALVGSARNCTFDGCAVTGAFTDGGPNYRTGALAHWASDCTFKDCSASGKIVSGERNVGGLVGHAEDCTFVNCSSSAAVTGKSHAGGIVGEASNCTFDKCRATGTVTAAGWSGGFVGDAINCTFMKCRSSGTVVAQPSLADNSSTYSCRIGGFAGYVEYACSFTDCYSSATVSAPEDEDAGGFAGYIHGVRDTSMSTFKRCYTTGAVTGMTGVGGFVGVLDYCNMEDCYSKCTTTAIGEDVGAGLTSAQLGGFVGEINDTRTTLNLTRCYAMGKVKAPASSGFYSLVYAGGFSWYQDYITAANWSKVTCTDCYWDASGTGQSKSIFGKSLSASQINSRIAAVSWYTDSAKSAARVMANSADSTLDGNSVAAGTVLYKASAIKALQSVGKGSLSPRLYCYERYVAVKDFNYSFKVSADDGAEISVSGLPSGFSFANGAICGSTSAAGETTMTITAKNAAGTVTREVLFVVIPGPKDFSKFMSRMVTFNANGGSCDTVTRILPNGSVVGSLPTPTRTDYTFAGWFTAASGGTQISPSTKVTANVTYYAHWKGNFKPNLAVKSITACRTTVYIGETFHLRYVVANTGEAAAGQSATGVSDGNGRYSTSQTCEGLAVGSEQAYRLNINSSTLGVGTHVITISVDKTGSIAESSELDNSKVIYLRVDSLPATSSTVDWQFHAKSGSPAVAYLSTSASSKKATTKFKQGDPIYIQINFWNALKGNTAGEVRAAALLDTGKGNQWNWNGLKGGVVAYILDSARKPEALQNLLPGTYTLEILLDNARFHDGTYVWPEANKLNNAMTIEFTVLGNNTGSGTLPALDADVAGQFDGSFAKAQTEVSALCDKNGAFVGSVQMKAGKLNARTGKVKVSASVTLLVDGKVKKISAKAVQLEVGGASATFAFKAPIGEMAFVLAADGTFTLKNASYLAVASKVGGALKGESSGAFSMEGFNLSVPGTLLDELLPNEESFSVSNGKWKFDKAATVKWAKPKKGAALPEIYDEQSGKGLIVDTDKGKTNLSGLKLTYTPKTGVFKGSFKVYALEGEGKKAKLKTYTVNVNGFVVDGVGYGKATCKKPAISWSVMVE